MKPLKCFACGLVMALLFVFAALPAAQAAQNLDIWPVDGTAKGDRSAGQLTVYYEVVDETGCTLDVPFAGQPTVNMIFLLRLYEKKTKTWHIITSEYEGPFCLTGDAIPPSEFELGAQQEALMTFLNTEVLDALTGSDIYTTVILKDVTDDYENTVTQPLGPPYCVSADIVIVAQ